MPPMWVYAKSNSLYYYHLYYSTIIIVIFNDNNNDDSCYYFMLFGSQSNATIGGAIGAFSLIVVAIFQIQLYICIFKTYLHIYSCKQINMYS